MRDDIVKAIMSVSHLIALIPNAKERQVEHHVRHIMIVMLDLHARLVNITPLVQHVFHLRKMEIIAQMIISALCNLYVGMILN